MNKKIFYWGLYDFANSLITTNLTLYFSQWVIIDNHFPDIWYGASIALSTIFLIISAPIFGSISDILHKKMAFINPLTIIIALTILLLGIVGGSLLPVFQKVLIAIVLYIIIQYAYQLSLVFYDTLLADLTTKASYGKVSGIGDAMGNLGSIIGLFLTLPFVTGKITLFNTPGRIQAFIPAGFGFLLLALPMMLSFKDGNLKRSEKVHFDYKELLTSLKDVLKNKDVFWFLIAFYFISDVVLTIQTFFPIYLETVLKLTDFEKIVATIAILVFIILGGVTLGKLSDTLGAKKVMLYCNLVLLIMFSIFPIFKTSSFLWFFIPVAGIFWGGFYSSSRALLTKLAPVEKRGEFFSLYTIFRRSASILGPLIWGGSVLFFSQFGINKYRFSIYPLIIFMIIGIFLLNKVSDDKQKTNYS